MQFDVILWFIMFTLWWFNREKLVTRLPLLILSSNFVSLLLFNIPDGIFYYYLEGIRHISTILLMYYLFIKEGYMEYYLSYFLVYLGITTLFFTGLFVVFSNIDIDTLGIALYALEFMVFIYGILFIEGNYSCRDGR